MIIFYKYTGIIPEYYANPSWKIDMIALLFSYRKTNVISHPVLHRILNRLVKFFCNRWFEAFMAFWQRFLWPLIRKISILKVKLTNLNSGFHWKYYNVFLELISKRKKSFFDRKYILIEYMKCRLEMFDQEWSKTVGETWTARCLKFMVFLSRPGVSILH